MLKHFRTRSRYLRTQENRPRAGKQKFGGAAKKGRQGGGRESSPNRKPGLLLLKLLHRVPSIDSKTRRTKGNPSWKRVLGEERKEKGKGEEGRESRRWVVSSKVELDQQVAKIKRVLTRRQNLRFLSESTSIGFVQK